MTLTPTEEQRAESALDKVKRVNALLRAGEPDNITVDNHSSITYTGYEPQAITDAMNEVFGLDGWGATELSSEKDGNTIVAQMQGWLRGIERTPTAWGQNNITSGNVGDARKAAQTDATKKVLSQFSVGSRAYLGLLPDKDKKTSGSLPGAYQNNGSAPGKNGGTAHTNGASPRVQANAPAVVTVSAPKPTIIAAPPPAPVPPALPVQAQQAQATQTLVDTRRATQQKLEKELDGPYEIEAYLTKHKMPLKMEEWTMQQCHEVIQKNVAFWLNGEGHRLWEMLPTAQTPLTDYLKGIRERQIAEIKSLADSFNKDYKMERSMLRIRDTHRLFQKADGSFLSTSTGCSVGLLDRLIAIGRSAQEVSALRNEFTYSIPEQYDLRLLPQAGETQAQAQSTVITV